MNKRLFAALATVILGAGLISGIATYVAAAKNDSGITLATADGTFTTPDGKTLPHYTLKMNTYPDSKFGGQHGAGGGAHPEWISYGLAGPNGEILSDAKTGTNFQVPPHSAITITIWQYDSGGTLNNDFFSHVRGTVGNTAKFVLSYDTKTHANVTPEVEINGIPTDEVGHTFTIHGMANLNDPFFVNVPLHVANDDEVTKAGDAGGYTQHPTKTTFTIITGGEGEYVWNCEFPCGDGTIARFGSAMSTMSYMSGHFVVKA